MSEMNRIIGQNHIIEHFTNAIKMDKISHAYIINGEANSGKKDLAMKFAMALLCEESNGEPCGKCKACRQVLSKNHPDVKWITYEKTGIGVDEVREQINGDITIKPYYNGRKIYIVPEAEKMNEQAQNALLKTIEEPPSYAVIILLTTNADSFLQTILSRCVLLNVRPVREDTIVRYLKSDFDINDYDARIAAAFAEGNPGKAVKLATSEDFNQLKDEVVSSITSIVGGSMLDIASAIKRAADYKSDIQEYLDLVRIWFRDILVYKACKSGDKIIFQSEISTIQRISEKCSLYSLDTILTETGIAKERIQRNVNFESALEVLFMAIRERIKL